MMYCLKLEIEMSFYNSCKSILYKRKYYSISYKLNFILNKNELYHEKESYNIELTDNVKREFSINDRAKTEDRFILDKLVTNWKISIKYNVVYYYSFNKLHRENGPAIVYFENNKLDMVEFRINNKLHRTDGPAVILYNKDEIIIQYTFYNNGEEYEAFNFDRSLEYNQEYYTQRKKILKYFN